MIVHHHQPFPLLPPSPGFPTTCLHPDAYPSAQVLLDSGAASRGPVPGSVKASHPLLRLLVIRLLLKSYLKRLFSEHASHQLTSAREPSPPPPANQPSHFLRLAWTLPLRHHLLDCLTSIVIFSPSLDPLITSPSLCMSPAPWSRRKRERQRKKPDGDKEGPSPEVAIQAATPPFPLLPTVAMHMRHGVAEVP